MKYLNGIYTGLLTNNLPNGLGELAQEFSVVKGKWINGKIAEGTITFADETMFKGHVIYLPY